jgi:sialate O-acetylesterase
MRYLGIVFLLTFMSTLSMEAQITPHRLISEGMVLQREMIVPIFGGGGSPEHPVEILFRGETYRVAVESDGSWEALLQEQQPGGPFGMVIRQPGDTLSLKEVYVGDVWVGSGQSNMDMAMRMAWPLYEQVIETASNPEIRHFWVPKLADFNGPQTDLSGGQWVPVSPEHNARLSAVAFFFAQHIHDTQHIPVGIITASLGGSPAEAWISEQGLSEWPNFYQEAIRYRNAALVDSIEQSDARRRTDWYDRLNREDLGYRGTLPWHHPDVDHSGWPVMDVPGTWADAIASGALTGTEVANDLGINTEGISATRSPLNGVVWVRRDLYLDETPSPDDHVMLTLGAIVDADSVFINGIFVGRSTSRHPPRWYTVPDGVLRKGNNTIAIRIFNLSAFGGFVMDKPYELSVGRGETAHRYPLDGPWHFRPGAVADPLDPPTNIRRMPMGLFNSMIAPLLRYPISGVIWYQGESNGSRAEEYRSLFPDLIKDWRNHWNQGEFPFLFVQLANYMPVNDNPTPNSNWAMLREAQFLTTQLLPNTGMAVAIDVGEWNDIHPLNKKDVGNRLALSARKLAYGEDIPASGPVFRNAMMRNGRVILEFDEVYGGLKAGHRPDTQYAGDGAEHNELGGFAVAGADGQYVWAEASIEGERVVVWSDDVPAPVSVRYAWANNPIQANLYNAAGLPAVPFRYPSEVLSPKNLLVGDPEVVTQGFRFTEGPYWHPDGYLLFSDIPANTVYRWTPGNPVSEVFLNPSGNANGIKSMPDGTLVLAQHAGRVSSLNEEGELQPIATQYMGRRLNSPNDIAVRTDGKLYFTDPRFGVSDADRELDFCGVFRVDPDGNITMLFDGFALPNGLAFSPDESFLYVNDSTTGDILRFGVTAEGDLLEPVAFANIGARGRLGGADGMVTDANGRLYTTGPNGLIIFDADGRQIEQYIFPHQITNLAWGLVDDASGVQDLFITSPNAVYRVGVNP